MSDVVIKVENLSKQYRLGVDAGSNRMTALLQKQISNLVNWPRHLLRKHEKNTKSKSRNEWIWALEDVNLEVRSGEVLGIIGPNGSGKSTLLKILSKITRPTKGRVGVRGRIGSLLEVGTGFHPELTGRENIFLNGAILGMSRREIRAKLEEIVAFAEIEQFLDTPVKRYSSGMYTRLAFAVAAHLEPEILVVDEVLAVGDLAFQKKCLGKMGELSREQRTVLLVSHNMALINHYCHSAMLLSRGELVSSGMPGEVIKAYMDSSGSAKGYVRYSAPHERPGDEDVQLTGIEIRQSDSETPVGDVEISKPIEVHIDFRVLREDQLWYAGLWLKRGDGTEVLASASAPGFTLEPVPDPGRKLPIGHYRGICVFPPNFLNSGQYRVTAILHDERFRTRVLVEDAITFLVHDTGEMRETYQGDWLGAVRPKLSWRVESVTATSP